MHVLTGNPSDGMATLQSAGMPQDEGHHLAKDVQQACDLLGLDFFSAATNAAQAASTMSQNFSSSGTKRTPRFRGVKVLRSPGGRVLAFTWEFGNKESLAMNGETITSGSRMVWLKAAAGFPGVAKNGSKRSLWHKISRRP